MVKIKVIDAICGAGKTSYAIQKINDASRVTKITNEFGREYRTDKKYIYVTPFLSEVQRVVNSTKAEFSEPKNIKGSKVNHLRFLIEEDKSIVMTHELFARMDEELLSDIEMAGYTLIMDEVANVLQQVKITKDDIKVMINSGLITIGENGLVEWIQEGYEASEMSRFSDIKVLADTENLYIQNNVAMFWTMNVNAFKSFEEIFILTYLFDGQIQKYYYDLHELDYEKYSIIKEGDRYELCEYDSRHDNRERLRNLLNIYQDGQENVNKKSYLNSNYHKKGNSKYSEYWLSKSWFDKATEAEIRQLKNNLTNYFRNHAPTENNRLYWTTIKAYANDLKNPKCKFSKKDDRSKDNYLPFNARATNDYADCVSMAYAYNRFINPLEKKFFEIRGVKVDEDLLAVSDLVQFLFRGCIRKGEVMHCYIPSPRMRVLLIDWLNYKI